jgi:hypothetical protein
MTYHQLWAKRHGTPPAPDEFVGGKAHGRVALNGDLAGEARVPETLGQAIMPLHRFWPLVHPYPTSRTKTAPAAVEALREAGIRREIMIEQNLAQVRAGRHVQDNLLVVPPNRKAT